MERHGPISLRLFWRGSWRNTVLHGLRPRLEFLNGRPRVNFYAFSALKGEHAYSGDCGHPFRLNAASDSERMRSPVPGESGQISERSDAGGSIAYEFIPDGSSGVKFCALFLRMDSPLRGMV